jgi:hypothetical protein
MNTKTILFLAISSFLFSCGGGEAVNLKLNVSAGDVFESRVIVDQKITTSAMGMKLDVDQVMDVYQTLTVKAVDNDGNTTMESVTDRFVMKQNMPMMGTPINVEFDTDNPEKAGAIGESMAPYFQKMKGLTYQLALDPRGKLIRSDIQEVYKKLGMDSLSEQGGNKTPEGNSEQYMTILPDKPLKKGDKYVVELPSTGAGFAQKNTYTVKEISADIVTFEVAGEFIPAKSEKLEGATVEVSGTQTGTVQIDRKTGMTVKSDLKQDLKMNITSMGMSMPTTSTGTITFTCTKK